MTLGELKRLIREFGVDDTLRHQAGIFACGGVSSNVTDREVILSPPPGLGSPQEQEDKFESDEQQKKSQPGARVDDERGGRAAGSIDFRRKD